MITMRVRVNKIRIQVHSQTKRIAGRSRQFLLDYDTFLLKGHDASFEDFSILLKENGLNCTEKNPFDKT